MKRIFGLLLAVVLLVTLIPVRAFATETGDTGFKASSELIAVIKQWEGFAKFPIWDYGQYSVGYGTRAPDEHLERYRTEGISEEEATQLLESYMNDMGASVNSFIKKHNLQANQGMFDAMLSLTYNCGPRWMLEVSTLRTAILDGWKGSDFIFAFGQWSTAGGATVAGLVRRRLAEANMYLNGQYSTALPSNFCYVQFNANGGKTDIVTQGYDSNEDVAIRPVPTYQNFTFDGWYTDPTGGEKIEKLDATVNGYTLYAHWRSGDGTGMPSDTNAETITGNPVSYSREVNALSLNAFDQPVKGALVVDSFGQYEIVDVVAEYTDSSGVKWGRVNGSGWINLSYTQDVSDGNEAVKVTVKVTGTDVNIRRGPGTSYAAVGKANIGDVLDITRTATGSGYTWGKFSKGWIALKYTNYDQAVNDSMESEPTGNGVMGTVNVNEFLRIREMPGVANAVVGMLGPKDRVEILEQKAVGGTIWGRIDRGWISMDYVILDKQEQKPEDSTPPTTVPEDTTPPTAVPEETTPPTTEPEKPVEVTGKVKLSSGYLNVRSGPSTGYKVCDKYANGASVTILEQKTVGTMVWGRTDKGWVSMTYIKLDTVETPVQPEQPSEPEQPTTPETSTQPETTQLSGKVSLVSGCLRIRSGAGTGNKIVGNLYDGNSVTILEQKTVGGTKWGRISSGWICMDYVKLTGDTASQPATDTITGIVNVNEFLRIRSGAGTNYSLVGYYQPKNRVTITETKMVGGTKWGRTDRGWISMDYIIVDGENSTQESDATNAITGTVVLNSGVLRIRSGAGTDNKVVGSLSKGNKVTILETKSVDGTEWGRITKGWVCMDYIKTN